MKNTGFGRMLVILLIMTVSVVMLAGCGSGEEAGDTSSADVAAEGSQDAGGDASGDWNDVSEEPEIDISALGGPGGVDVDLTALSSTMVYAVVNDMLMEPDPYMGKKVRMKGSMAVYQDEDTGKTYYACIISDATACCAQGIEFTTTDEFRPEDYPEEGEELTVVGKYDFYEEDGYQYGVLRDAVFE